MHVRRATTMIAVAITAVALAAPAANARAASGGNVCKLLSASQLTSVHVPAGCSQKSGQSRLGKLTLAIWGDRHGAYVLADVYDVNPAYAARAKSVFAARGTSVGVGDWSRFEGFTNGHTQAKVTFGVGRYIVGIAVRTPTEQPLTSSKPLIAIAKTMAAKLR